MKKLVIYPGRFQPFTINHYKTYKHIKSKFNDEDTLRVICTSDKVEQQKSPFNFKQKKAIINKIFKLKNVFKVNNPYSPKQAVQFAKKYFNTKQVALIVVIGEKDKNRLQKGSYYKKYKQDMQLQTYDKKGYYYIAPTSKVKYKGQQLITGTFVRQKFKTHQNKQQFFKQIYPSFNKRIFKLFQTKLTLFKQLSVSAAVSGFSTPYWHLPDGQKRKDGRLHIDSKDQQPLVIGKNK